MSFFKNFDWSIKSIAKVAGLAMLGIVGFSVVIAMIGFSFRTVFQQPSGYDRNYAMDYAESATMNDSLGVVRSKISMPVPEPSYSSGDDAENYEVKSYSASIKSRNLEKTCSVIAGLKSRTEVIFETSNQNEENCYYRFKVKKDAEKEIVALLNTLKPEDLNENIQTIKGTLEAYDKQLEILEKKLASIEETLKNAQSAYDDVADLAAKKQDVESLAMIIDNKLNLIDKMTNERLNIKEQIDRYIQNKADQLERLNYSFFDVNIYKDKIFDWKQIKDSWKYELKAFVRNFNEVLQGVSVNLVTYMIRFVQVAIYFFISLFLLKAVWTATKRVWKGRGKGKKR